MKHLMLMLAVSATVFGLLVSGRHYTDWQFYAIMLSYTLYHVFMRLREMFVSGEWETIIQNGKED